VPETKAKFEIYISNKFSVKQIIQFALEWYEANSSKMNWKPLINMRNPNLYDLRVIDDEEEDEFQPLEEIAALDPDKKFGEIGLKTVALCLKKNYQEISIPNEELKKIATQQNVNLLRSN